MGIPRHIDKEAKADEERKADYRTIEEILETVPNGLCRRMIIIDGPNVIHSAGRSGKNIMDIKVVTDKLSSTAILIIVQKLLEHQFEVMVSLKKFFEEDKNSDNHFILTELEDLEILRFLVDEIDDDELLLRTAEFYGGAVVSRDHFRQVQYERYKEGKKRAISFRFDRSEVPKDQFHKAENVTEMFSKLKFLNFEKAFAIPGDPDYEKVKKHYDEYLDSGFYKLIAPKVKCLSEFLQLEMCEYTHTATKPYLPYFDTSKNPCPVRFAEFKNYYVNKYGRN